MSVRYGADPILLWDSGISRWHVYREFSVAWDRDATTVSYFMIPAGFKTDLASIPRAFRSLIPQIGRHLQAAVAHDWCYCGHTDFTRAEADQLFYEGMCGLGVPWWKRQAMYAAVRACGSSLWKGKC